MKNPTGPGGGVGTLNLTVKGLPGGVAARVNVSGTLGTTRAVTGSTVLTGLPQDTYTISALYVTNGAQAYNATVAPATVGVLAGQTAQASVTYAPGATPNVNLSIAGVQIIQSTQRSDNSVPMVAGRNVLLRVFVTAAQANTVAPSVRVRLYQGGLQVDSLTVAAPSGSVPLTVDTTTLSSSWNLVIPAARVQPTLSILAVVDPNDAVLETDESDNRFPVSGTPQPVNVQTVAALHVRFVPVIQGGLTGNVTNSNKDQLFGLTPRMYPIGVADVDVHAPFTSAYGPLVSNDSNNAWGNILSEMYALQTAEGSGRDYVGLAGTSYSSGIAGLGYVGAPAALAWDKSTSAPTVITHELGHNFGRIHSPCGVTGDPAYPYTGAKIGVWGYDQGTSQLKPPVADVDIMSYCSPIWVSDWTYMGVLNFRGPGPMVVTGGLAGGLPAGPPSMGPGLLVWGRITSRGIELEPAFSVNAVPSLPTAPGPYRLTGSDASGAQLFDLSFAGNLVADLPGGPERHFAFVVPLAQLGTGLASLRLTDGRLITTRQGSAALTGQSQQAPLVTPPTAVRVNAAEADVRWDPRYPMALIRDAKTGAILSFGRAGRSRIVTAGSDLSVELSDGVSSRQGIDVRVAH